MLGFGSQLLPLITVWPRGSYLTSVCLRFIYRSSSYLTHGLSTSRVLRLKHCFHNCWLLLLQLACETQTLLNWKAYIPCSDLRSSELVNPGFIRNHFSSLSVLDLLSLVYCLAFSACEDSLSAAGSWGRAVWLSWTVSQSSASLHTAAVSPTSPSKCGCGLRTPMLLQGLGGDSVQLWELSRGRTPCSQSGPGWKRLSRKELSVRSNLSLCFHTPIVNCIHAKGGEVRGRRRSRMLNSNLCVPQPKTGYFCWDTFHLVQS